MFTVGAESYLSEKATRCRLVKSLLALLALCKSQAAVDYDAFLYNVPRCKNVEIPLWFPFIMKLAGDSQ